MSPDCSLAVAQTRPARSDIDRNLAERLRLAELAASLDASGRVSGKKRLGAFGESARCDGTLPPPEPSIFQPGTLDPPVPVGVDVAAVAICADIGDPAHAERARARGASAYLASMFVIPSEFGGDVAGRSTIWSEQGEMLVRLPNQGAGVALAARITTGWRTASAMLDEA